MFLAKQPGNAMAQRAGTLCTLPQVAYLVGTRPRDVPQVLSGCVAGGKVKASRDGKRTVRSVRTTQQIRSEHERAERRALSQRVLQGDDATNRRFRELCMASRRPLSGSQNGDRDSQPHD